MKELKIYCSGTKYLHIDELKAFQGNLKELKKPEYQKLWHAIETKGFRFPVFLWQDHDFILDGHQRIFVLKDMLKAGFSIGDIPCVEIQAESEKEAKELVLLISSRYGKITDEGVYEFISTAGIDFESLKRDIDFPEINLDRFELSYFKDGKTDDDEVPPIPKNAKSKIGDLYSLGRHRLLCGDATKKEDIERLMDGKKADMVFTDPPYGINIVRGVGASNGGAKEYGRVRQPGGKPSGVVGGKGIVKPRLYMPIAGDDKPFDPVFLLSLSQKIILWGANCYSSKLPDSLGWIVWEKGVSPAATFSACELAWTNIYNHIKSFEYRWSGMVRSGNRKDELKDRVHPTQKPVGLFVQIFQNVKAINILDPFLGSGSTLIACEKTNRICYGMEIEPLYIDVIIKRWEDYTGGKAEMINGGNFMPDEKR